MDIAEFVIY